MFEPRFSIPPKMAKRLMEIQEANTVVEYLPLPGNVLQEMQRESAINRVILSTKIEGSRLSERQMRKALQVGQRSSAEQEVVNLSKAMDFLDRCAERRLPITEELIKQLHAIIRVIPGGKRPAQSGYRTVQNKVADERTGVIVYLPPEPRDVPTLMEDLVAWVNRPETQDIPAPIQAGIFMWQFLTIHPYVDGNGRTARALATYLLRQHDLWLKGLFVLESYYDRNLDGYYKNLQMGLPHNYYFGRNDADLTPWLDFFIDGLAEVFREAAELVRSKSLSFMAVEPDLLRRLDPSQRVVFAQMAFRTPVLTTSDLAKLLNLRDRTVRERLKRWIAEGFLRPRDEHAKRIRSVVLTEGYEELAQAVREDPERYRYLLGD
ncbi:Fic family protein [Kyrpidia spormannii]|uniref:Fic family protein n=1 Tax=Kyrpidia spormannii TaxID=2055160 RepID=A0A2K8N3N2_9BACL|nr:Fic family protein [Kyrpidia spormannii]ATY83815.1 Fic family protein [Kyrpidia spormannii]